MLLKWWVYNKKGERGGSPREPRVQLCSKNPLHSRERIWITAFSIERSLWKNAEFVKKNAELALRALTNATVICQSIIMDGFKCAATGSCGWVAGMAWCDWFASIFDWFSTDFRILHRFSTDFRLVFDWSCVHPVLVLGRRAPRRWTDTLLR